MLEVYGSSRMSTPLDCVSVSSFTRRGPASATMANAITARRKKTSSRPLAERTREELFADRNDFEPHKRQMNQEGTQLAAQTVAGATPAKEG